jgi:hypothetical protein
MAEQLTIHCDRCRARIPASQRTKIRWSREPVKRETTDLCTECAEAVVNALGSLVPPMMPETGEPRIIAL